MKHATTTTKTKEDKVRTELKNICTADVDASTTPSQWCRWCDKLSVLFKLRHAWRTQPLPL